MPEVTFSEVSKALLLALVSPLSSARKDSHAVHPAREDVGTPPVSVVSEASTQDT